MPSYPSHEDLFFGPSKKDWLAVAQTELGNKKSVSELFHPAGRIQVGPYYDTSDLPFEADRRILGITHGHQEPRSWCNAPMIEVKEANAANQAALALLTHGAGGIFFDIRSEVDVGTLLKDIELPFCSLFFRLSAGKIAFARAFMSLVEKKKVAYASLNGAFFWTDDPPADLPFNQNTTFHSGGLTARQANREPDEIAALLEKSVRQLDKLIEHGATPSQALSATAFSISLGRDFFWEIARLKVLRRLWHQIANVYVPGSNTPVFIHADVEAWSDDRYEPNSHMLANSTAVLSAVLGGGDAVTPINGSSPMSTRVAMNVSALLQEEARIGRVADPTAGSYYLETVIDQLCQETWANFQERVT